MAEPVNLGSTMVLLTLTDGRKTLVNVETVLRFSERERNSGSLVHFKGVNSPIEIREDPEHVRKLITGAKLADMKELMTQISKAQQDLFKDITKDFPSDLGGDGRNPFGDRGPNDFDS